MYSALVYLPFFIQGVRGTSPLSSGLWLLPLTLSIVIASAWAGHRIASTGKYKKMALWSLLLSSLSLFGASFMGGETSPMMVIIIMTGIGRGLGVNYPIFNLTVQNSVDRVNVGAATSSTQLFRQLGGAAGVGIMGTAMQWKMEQSDMKIQALGATGTDDLKKLGEFETLINQDKVMNILSTIPLEKKAKAVQAVDQLRIILGEAFSLVFLIGSLTIIICFILTLLIKEVPLKGQYTKKTLFRRLK